MPDRHRHPRPRPPRLAAALALIASAPLAAQTRSAPPAPPASAWSARLGRELARVVSQGDSAALERFLAARLAPSALGDRPLAAHRELWRTIHRQSGGELAVRGVRPLGHGTLQVLWAGRIDRGIEIFLEPDPADSLRIRWLAVLGPVSPAAEIRLPDSVPGGEGELLAVVERELERLAAAGEFSGVVGMARRGKVLFLRGVGWANREAGIPVGPHTRFHLASLGKSLTAVAIGQLVERGQLRLDDSVASLLPEHDWHPEARGITVRHLLEHTSGLGQADSAPAGIVAAVARAGPAFAPGTRWAYSNDGYEMLGAIIEKVSGEPYAEYVARHVLAPAGMRDTDFFPADTALPNRAIGYARRETDYFGREPREPNTPRLRGKRGTAAGGAYATVPDLLRFADALHRGALLRRATLDTLTTPGWPLPGPIPGERYGYGFSVRAVGGTRGFGNGGGGANWGICSSLITLADGSATVAVLSNGDPPVCMQLAHRLAGLLARLP
ncbi:MAG TPA: serine hydrolase domain-containing protein [Gemmatimonadales bacterium]|nr:serine hydrolase domain-containing protein [Gemmatimonadales bacterium]